MTLPRILPLCLVLTGLLSLACGTEPATIEQMVPSEVIERSAPDPSPAPAAGVSCLELAPLEAVSKACGGTTTKVLMPNDDRISAAGGSCLATVSLGSGDSLSVGATGGGKADPPPAPDWAETTKAVERLGTLARISTGTYLGTTRVNGEVYQGGVSAYVSFKPMTTGDPKACDVEALLREVYSRLPKL